MRPTSHAAHQDPLRHLNSDHLDELLLTARAFSGHRDATAARAERVDAGGIDLVLETPGGQAAARVEFGVPIDDFPAGFRVAFVRLVRLVRRARTAPA